MKPSTSTGAAIRIRNLRKAFGSAVAVDDVSLDVEPGEFLALLGPSGSGKSTILMSIAGFESPTSGQILMDGVDCTHIAPHRRNVGMVFQNYTLFPHLSVLDNVAFPLKMRGLAKAERHAQAEQALKSVHLGGYGARMPHQLSGGQQQRVALARAIVYKPRLLLMDEPFSALDKKLRQEMRLETKRLHAELGLSVVFVTHDQEEALTMSDRVAVLKDGRLQQIGSAHDLYERPVNLFVAGFIGDMNFIPATFTGECVRLPGGEAWSVPPAAVVGELSPGSATVAIRPERLSLAANPGDLRLAGRVTDVIYSGADTLVLATLEDGTPIQARTSSLDRHRHRVGDAIALHCPTDAPLVYGAASA
ncbi:ABC transporter ATP-binding protein [Ramlibacter sp.]|uniref:ABC transporter ATP-binding protein n=1 Tax=Ramlibacter sp. TaxID=1917967 RepID=UPI003D0BBFD2